MPYLVSRLERKPDRSSLYYLFARKQYIVDSTATRTYLYKDLTPKTAEERLKISDLTMDFFSFREKNRELIRLFKDNKFNYEKQIKLESKYRKELKSQYSKNDLEIEVRKKTKERLEEEGDEYCELYHTFYVPKKKRNEDGSIKWRRIDAPCQALMHAQRMLKELISDSMNGLTYHTAACGYVEKRSVINANKKHSDHGSRFSLLIDCQNFFNSITMDFVMQQLKTIFPFSEIVKLEILGESGEQILEDCLKICFLNGVLPQGTPISPMLTNIIMIPIDHKINNDLQSVYNAYSKKGFAHKFVYTRYADDIRISNRICFKPEYKDGILYSNVKNKNGKAIDLEKYIKKVLKQFNAPFTINQSKTKYNSIYTNNFYVGISTNQYNQLTLGGKKKDLLKAQLWDFGCKYKQGIMISPDEAAHLLGTLNYHKQVEKDRTARITQSRLKKLGIEGLSFEDMLKNCIKG